MKNEEISFREAKHYDIVILNMMSNPRSPALQVDPFTLGATEAPVLKWYY